MATTIVSLLMDLSPNYGYDSKTGYAKSTIGYKLDSKKGAKQCQANTTCNSHDLANSSLISQKPAALVAHHEKMISCIRFIKLPKTA
jgi:hypothetical protein